MYNVSKVSELAGSIMTLILYHLAGDSAAD